MGSSPTMATTSTIKLVKPNLDNIHTAGIKIQKQVEDLQKELEKMYVGREIFLPRTVSTAEYNTNVNCPVASLLVHRCDTDTENRFEWMRDMQVTFFPPWEDNLDDNIITIPLYLLDKLKFLV